MKPTALILYMCNFDLKKKNQNLKHISIKCYLNSLSPSNQFSKATVKSHFSAMILTQDTSSKKLSLENNMTTNCPKPSLRTHHKQNKLIVYTSFHSLPSKLHKSNGYEPEFVTPMLKDCFEFESITNYICCMKT